MLLGLAQSLSLEQGEPKLPPPVYEDTSGPGGYVFAQY